MPHPEIACAGVDDEHRPRLVLVLVGTALLAWPSALNWHPYLFWDTYGYFLQGKAYGQLLLGWSGLWTPPPEVAAGWIGAAGRMLARDPSIRSPTWSLLSWGLAAGGGFWLLALLDALVAAATVELFLARLLGVAPARRLAIMAGMALLTSLPWFASYLMPDLYAGLMILAVTLAAFAWSALTRVERSAVLALYLLSITFHSTHLLLAVALLPLAVLLPVAGDGRAPRAMRLGLPILAAVVLLLAASWLGFGRLTLTPQGAPFLLARSWEDGPARAYLEATCPGAGWAICPQIGRLAGTAQDFLWRPDDSYWSMDLQTRAAVRAEELGILLPALAHDPWRQVTAALTNGAMQLGQLGLDDLVLGRGAAVTPEDYTFVYQPSAPAAVWGVTGFSVVIYVTVAVALGGLLVWTGRARAPIGDPVLACVLLVLAALILNAAICGALSGVHPRYQSRVVWLLPLLAAGLLARPAAAVTAARGAPEPPAP